MKGAIVSVMCRWVVAALGVLTPGALAAQAVVTGTVREDSTGRPLAGVEVIQERGTARSVTDSRGRYSLGALPVGRQILLFRSLGFRPVRQWVLIGGPDTVWANIMLAPGAVELPSIGVTAEGPARPIWAESFEEHRKMGFGKFFDSTWLERKGPQKLGTAMGGGGNHVAAASTRRYGPQGEPCYMTVYLDGVLLFRSPGPPGFSTRNADPGTESPPDLNQFSAAEFAAVELYRGAAEVPQEYAGASAACGVLLLWTKRG